MYERVLVALDGSPLAERILPHVEALAKRFGSVLILLRAIPPVEKLVPELAVPEAMAPEVFSSSLLDEAREEARGYLARVATDLQAQGITVEVEYPQGDAARLILTRAQELGVDLIAMTTHGHSGLGRLFFGSVAEEVLHHAGCAVLLVRAHEPE